MIRKFLLPLFLNPLPPAGLAATLSTPETGMEATLGTAGTGGAGGTGAGAEVPAAVSSGECPPLGHTPYPTLQTPNPKHQTLYPEP